MLSPCASATCLEMDNPCGRSPLCGGCQPDQPSNARSPPTQLFRASIDARALAGDTFVDKVIEVANATLAGEHDPNAARIAIRAYQWTAGKLNSAEYGDNARVDIDVTLNDADTGLEAPEWIRNRLRQHKTIEGEAGRVDKLDAGY